MPTEREYSEKIRRLDRQGLIRLWEEVRAKESSIGSRARSKSRRVDWAPGKAFEYLVLRAFELEEATVTWPFHVRWPSSASEIEQIDGAVHVDGLSCLVESKDSGRQSIAPIAKLRNQLMRRPSSTVGLIFSSGGFTESAQLAAHFLAPQTVLLWDGTEVDYCLRESSFRQGLLDKYQYAVEQGIPNYNVTERKNQ